MPQYELNFQDYLRILRKRKVVIISAFLISFLLAAFYTKTQPTVFQTSAAVRYEQRKTVISTILERVSWTRGDPLDTEIKVIEGRKMAEDVAKKLGLIGEKTPDKDKETIIGDIQRSVSADKMKDTNIIRISVTGSDPRLITRIANMTIQVYMEENLNQKRKELSETRQFIQERLAAVEKELNQAEERLKVFKEKEAVTGVAVELEKRIAELKGQISELITKATEKHPQIIRLKEEISQLEEQTKTLPASELEYARLKRDAQISEQTYRMLREKFEAARIAEAEKASDVTLVSQATEPKHPISPNKRLNLTAGSLMGLMLGFILAFVVENLDTSIGTIEDVENIIKLPVLGIIPFLEHIKRPRVMFWPHGRISYSQEVKEMKDKLLMNTSRESTLAEAYNILETNVWSTFQNKENAKSILITSTAPREGKSLTVANLAMAIAQRGKRVILIDADLRRPILHNLFGLKVGSGLTDILSGKAKFNESVNNFTDILMGSVEWDKALKVPGLNKLHILTAGQLHGHPPTLLSSNQMNNLIEELKTNYDIILFDSPPVLSVTDASIIGQKADMVILVYHVGRTPRSALLRSKVQLESTGAQVKGVVLNCITPQSEMVHSHYYYYQYRYYGKEKEGKK
ncbi:MAG: GNVR domain-containing protein [Candidatus Omnitrophota bacterium]